MQLALRVLTALTEKRYPDSDDVTKLRELAGPGHETTDPDVLACDVIHAALKHREEVRDALPRILTAGGSKPSGG